MTFENLKILLIYNKVTFKDLVTKDGRSYQYLHKECSCNNQRVLTKLLDLLPKKFISEVDVHQLNKKVIEKQ